jgi:carbamoyl-phosphate synthase large subunit
MKTSEHATVLVTGTGGAAGIAVLRALVRHGHTVLAADCDPYAAGLYLVPEAHRLVLPRGDDPAFAKTLHATATAHAVDVVIPTVDEELEALAAARPAFRAAGISVLVSPEAALGICLDKWQLVAMLASVIPVPLTTILDDDFMMAPDAFPVIVKPRRGRGGRGVALIHDIDELAKYPRDGAMIVQEYLPGDEYSVDVLVGRGGQVLASVPRHRMRVDSGVAIAACTVIDPELVRLGGTAAAHVGLRGPANVQFRRDADGIPRLLEINPRFPGSVALTIAAGVDLPALALDDMLGADPGEVPHPYREIAIVRYLDEVTVPVSEFGRVGMSHTSTSMASV